MTLQPAQKWIIVLVAIMTLGPGTLLFAETPLDPLEPVATYGDARFRYGESISSLCFSPDGKLLASSSRYWDTVLWDARTGELIRHLPSDHSSRFSTSPSHVAFSPDGKWLVVASNDLRVWTVASGELLYQKKNAGNRLVQFTRDGKHFLTVDDDGVVFIETHSGRIVSAIATGGKPTRIMGAALSPDGSQVIVATANKGKASVKTWALPSGEEILPRPRHESIDETLISLRFTPDEQSLVAVTGSFSFQQRFQLLDPRTLKFQREFKTHTGLVKSCEYTPDGKLLAVGTGDTRNYYIHLIDPAEGKLIRRWRVGDHGNGRGVRLAVSPDGQTVATAVEDLPDVKLWDTATGEERFPHAEGGTTSILRMLALGDGQTLVTQDENGRVIRRDLTSGRVAQDEFWTVPDSFKSMGMSPEATELMRSDWKRMIKEPQLKDSDLVADHTNLGRRLCDAKVSADGKRVAALYKETLIYVYDRRSGKRLRQFGDPEKPVRAMGRISDLELSADGSRLVFYYDRIRQAWNVETGEKLTPPSGGGAYHLAPDGTLVIAWKGQARLWHVDEGKFTATLNDEPHWIGEMAFSPDGKFMASSRGFRGLGSSDIAIWDLSARKVIHVLRGARGGVTSLCFSPDGQKLYACDNSTQTLAWDLSND